MVPAWTLPFFLGPLQTTASSGFSSRKPTDMRETFCSWSTKTGTQPPSHWCTALPCARSMRGMLGPHRSTSRIPTCKEPGCPHGVRGLPRQKETSWLPCMSTHKKGQECFRRGQVLWLTGGGAHLFAHVTQSQGQLRGNGAFPNPPLSRED